jgi:hypothetical protein
MRLTIKCHTFGVILSLLLLCSCATENSIRRQLPTDVSMNQGAGRLDELLLTLHLEDGEELLFLVDTGASFTILDKSFEPKLGTCFWTHRFWHVRYGMRTLKWFMAPKLYLGNTQLPTGRWISTGDLSILSHEMARMTHADRRVDGILGMDCLKRYCIQLDFASRKLRFLDSQYLNNQDLGKAFPLIGFRGTFAVRENLLGLKRPVSLIDTGCNFDGWFTPKLFQQWTNHAAPVAVGEVHSSNAILSEDSYPEVNLGETSEFGFNGIGLSFLARHLVTFDFPNRTMYLKRTSVGPLVDEDTNAALNCLKTLKEKNQLPGWSKNDQGRISSLIYPISNIFDARKNGESTIYHYKIVWDIKDKSWKLQAAWRTDQNDHTVETYSVR